MGHHKKSKEKSEKHRREALGFRKAFYLILACSCVYLVFLFIKYANYTEAVRF